MFRVAIIYDDKSTKGQNFNTEPEAETFVLEESERSIIKRADIKNLETQERKRVF